MWSFIAMRLVDITHCCMPSYLCPCYVTIRLQSRGPFNSTARTENFSNRCTSTRSFTSGAIIAGAYNHFNGNKDELEPNLIQHLKRHGSFIRSEG